MKTPHARWPIQVFRIASVVVPSALAWNVAFSAPHPTPLIDAVKYVLGPLWMLMAAALASRSVDALLPRRRPRSPGADEPSLLDRIDVLTASGCSLSWLGAGAVMASVSVGWASLSVVGLMGLGLLHLVVLWTLLRVGGDDPWRHTSVSRRFVPENVVEGGPVIEELRFSDVRIPAGFRLFASGRIGPRWPTSRYVVEDAESSGELVLQSDVGPALRGEHQAEPLELWLQDVFGLCHSVRVSAGAARLTVLARTRRVDGARHLLGQGGNDREPRPAQRLPTEGSLRLREYQPGDDARRIHWVRSLTARELVVRLPDERSPDQPAVRLVLDTFLPGTEVFACDAPAELLDALVEVWLSVGRALVDAGARVTLVTAAPKDGAVAPFLRRLSPRALSPAQRLGAQVRWQDTLSVVGLLTEEPSIVVSYRLPSDLSEGGTLRWIVVPEPAWTRFDELVQTSSIGVLPHPIGSPDNRWSRRWRERLQNARARRDHAAFTELCTDRHGHRSGSFVARPAGPALIRLEALR